MLCLIIMVDDSGSNTAVSDLVWLCDHDSELYLFLPHFYVSSHPVNPCNYIDVTLTITA